MPNRKYKFTIKLNNNTAQLYQTFPNNKSFFQRLRGFCKCTSSPERPPTPDHAKRLYTTANDVNENWSVILLAHVQQELNESRKRSIHVFTRDGEIPLFHANIQVVKSNTDDDNVDDVSLIARKAVREVLKMSLVNGKSTDSVLKLDNGTSLILRCEPLFDSDDRLAGVLWSTKIIDTYIDHNFDGEGAALYCDASTGMYVMNQEWIKQGPLLTEMLTDGNTQAVVILSDTGHVDDIKNLEVAEPLLLKDRKTPPTDMDKMFIPQVTEQLTKTLDFMQHNTNEGQVLNGITMGDLNRTSYILSFHRLTTNKENTNGYILRISKTDSLSFLVDRISETH